MKNIFRNLIALSLVLTFSGCAAESQKKADLNANTITIWHWMSDRDDSFHELAKRFEGQTGIKVKIELFAPSEAYAQRVKASAQTGTLPDIYGILGEKRDFASFIRSGFVKNLSADMDTTFENEAFPWKDSFFEKALAVNQFLPQNEFSVEPGIYGVPLDATTIQMVYNKKLYAKAGLDPNKPPATWEEFVEHNRVLKKAGLPGFVSGFGEIWMLDALASNWAMNQMGDKKVFATYEGKVSYTDPDWVKVLSLFKQMADEKILVEGAVTMVNKTAEQTFANERATYAFNGSWCVNVYKGMNPGLDYLPMAPPRISEANPMRVWGGAGSSFVVNNESPRRDQAVKFMRWLTQEKQQSYLAQATENLPSTKASLQHISPVLSQFADDMETATHPNIYPVHEDPSVIEAFDKGIQSILIGEKTPEQVAQEVQKTKEKVLAKNSK